MFVKIYLTKLRKRELKAKTLIYYKGIDYFCFIPIQTKE